MAIELITGRAGTPHVDSADVGAFNASLFGGGAYILEGINAELVDANNVNVSAGELLCEGRHIRITGAGETLTIDNGLSAYKRNDIIAAHYLRDEDGLESVQLVVIKGEATVDAPNDPAMPTTGKLLEGASDVYWPIFRIVIDGLTPQPPVALAGRQAWYQLGAGEEIPAGADLNDYTEPGIYWYKSENIANTPGDFHNAYVIVREFNENAAVQEVHGITAEMYRRRYSPISSVTWTEWTAVGGIDSIVADGWTNGWYWVKYAGGKATAHRIVGAYTADIPWFGLYYCASDIYTFPFDFSENPTVNLTADKTGYPAIGANVETVTNRNLRFYVSSDGAAAPLIYVHIGVEGRWK